jgi:hypothetical protein
VREREKKVIVLTDYVLLLFVVDGEEIKEQIALLRLST